MTTHATNKKRNWNCELSLQQLLADPLVNAVMTADRVDAQELYEKLSQKARNLTVARPRREEQPSLVLAGCCG
jgi:hypothetical protein